MSSHTPRPSRGSVVTWRVPDFPNTPEGLCGQFCAIADHCLEDAKKLDALSEGWASPGEYILIAHALELSLKAFLAKHGLKEEELRDPPYRHDLDRLYDDAEGCFGLELASIPDAKRFITWVNEYHSRGDPIRHALRYAAETRTMPGSSEVFAIIDAILLATGASKQEGSLDRQLYVPTGQVKLGS
jgi:hypothetical protein